jgi:hypothetical protein
MTTKDTALTVTFTVLYAVFGFIKISPIIGLLVKCSEEPARC